MWVCVIAVGGAQALHWKTSAQILFLHTNSQKLMILEFLLVHLAPIVPMVEKTVECSQPFLKNGVSAEYLLPCIHNSIYFLQFQVSHCGKALPSEVHPTSNSDHSTNKILQARPSTRSHNQWHYITSSPQVFLLEVIPSFVAKVFGLFKAKGCQFTLHGSSSLTHCFLPFLCGLTFCSPVLCSTRF